jgi:hypothetical protein
MCVFVHMSRTRTRDILSRPKLISCIALAASRLVTCGKVEEHILTLTSRQCSLQSGRLPTHILEKKSQSRETLYKTHLLFRLHGGVGCPEVCGVDGPFHVCVVSAATAAAAVLAVVILQSHLQTGAVLVSLPTTQLECRPPLPPTQTAARRGARLQIKREGRAYGTSQTLPFGKRMESNIWSLQAAAAAMRAGQLKSSSRSQITLKSKSRIQIVFSQSFRVAQCLGYILEIWQIYLRLGHSDNR